MKDTPKYYKHKTSSLLVKALDYTKNNTFQGIVIIGNKSYDVSDEKYTFHLTDFEPYSEGYWIMTPIGATVMNDNPIYNTTQLSDIEIRLKCLEMASKNKNGQSESAIMQLAENYYEWVTQNK